MSAEYTHAQRNTFRETDTTYRRRSDTMSLDHPLMVLMIPIIRWIKSNVIPFRPVFFFRLPSMSTTEVVFVKRQGRTQALPHFHQQLVI